MARAAAVSDEMTLAISFGTLRKLGAFRREDPPGGVGVCPAAVLDWTVAKRAQDVWVTPFAAGTHGCGWKNSNKIA